LWKLQHRRPFGIPPAPPNAHDKNNLTPEAQTQQYKYWSPKLLLSQDQCRRTGTALYDFLLYSSQFRDRVGAAERLGLLCSTAPPDRLVGASMEVRDPIEAQRRLWRSCWRDFGADHGHQMAPTEWKPSPPPPSPEEASSSSLPPPSEEATAATTTPVEAFTHKQPPPPPPTGTPLLEPTTHYLHLPGTVPPTPSFPLDVVPILFGPPDRHEQVLHAGLIDEGVAQLTQSSLWGQLLLLLCEQQQRQTTNAHAAAASSSLRRRMLLLQKQLWAVLEQRVRLSQQHRLYRRCQTQLRMTAVELPLQFYYRAVADYCS
jgi:hypothetical protein